MLACICGGTFELLIVGLLTGVVTIVGDLITRILNRRKR